VKKTIVSFFSVCLLSSAVTFAGEVSSVSNNAVIQKKPSAANQVSSSSNYTSQLAMFKQMSEAYATKAHIASEKGKTELASAYKKCAEAAGNMIKSINTGQENLLISSKQLMQEAVANLNKLKGKADKVVSNKKQSLEQLSEAYAKRVVYYTKKAEKAKLKGDEALSKIMVKCANAKQEMYQAVNSVINGNKTYTDIISQNKNLGISVNKEKADKQRVHLKTKALNLQKSAVEISKKANKARLEGKSELSNCYSRMATAKQQMAYGYVSYLQGINNFKTARAELRSYNSSVNSGLVNPKQKKKNLISSEINVHKSAVKQAQQPVQTSQIKPNTEPAQMNVGSQLKPQLPQELKKSSMNIQPTDQLQTSNMDNAANQINSSVAENQAGNQLSSQLPNQSIIEPSASQAYGSLNSTAKTPQIETAGATKPQLQSMNTEQNNNQAIMSDDDITSPSAVSQVAGDYVGTENTDKQNLDNALINTPAPTKQNKVQTNQSGAGLAQ
jgi:hypothetical protein